MINIKTEQDLFMLTQTRSTLSQKIGGVECSHKLINKAVPNGTSDRETNHTDFVGQLAKIPSKAIS